MPVIINGDTGITQPNEFNSDSTFGYKNRLINPGMVIDQRNAGASVTPGDGAYMLDRWKNSVTQSSRISYQRVSTAPAGFTNSMLVTSLGATTVGANDTFGFYQPIEGFNIADLGFGTANAKSITVSFWVRSSITGTYSIAVTNGAVNRCYPVTYTIDSANTFEYKTITIPGDTTGTWATDNSSGLQLFWNLGAGSLYGGATSGAWTGSLKIAAAGQTNWVSTNGATFYITGTQLEVGTVATSFDFRNYGIELGLCYRYYRRYGPGNNQMLGAGYATSSTAIWRWGFSLDIPMRVAPTVLLNTCQAWAGSSLGSPASVSTSYTSTNFVDIDITTSGMGVAVVGGIAKMYLAGASPFIELSGAEL